jgi:hypothetical protein
VVHRSSELGTTGRRSEVLVDLCRRLGADRYLTPPGAVGYLAEDQHLFATADISVEVHQFAHPEYRQCYEPFVSHASAIDLLLNVGPRALETIRSGRLPATPLEAVIL